MMDHGGEFYQTGAFIHLIYEHLRKTQDGNQKDKDGSTDGSRMTKSSKTQQAEV